MSLETFHYIANQLSGIFNFNGEPLASALIILGLAILSIMILAGLIYGAIKVVKAVPNMPFKQFIIVMIMIAVFLVIVGVLIP
ncbi:hypothetical protein SUSAZ_06580 [Sulfolobus acidocaldarius SUSAZ]|nr:hypothetical protein SUSAZ_06580 [Sulfolobus acidocaldarius SUSAZ]